MNELILELIFTISENEFRKYDLLESKPDVPNLIETQNIFEYERDWATLYIHNNCEVIELTRNAGLQSERTIWFMSCKPGSVLESMRGW